MAFFQQQIFDVTYRLICMLCLAGLLSASACRNKSDFAALEAKSAELLREAVRLDCGMRELGNATEALWDSVSAALEAKLPESMPPDERRNMIAVRNTGLIRMFEVYPTLDTATRILVESAGERDQALAGRIRDIRSAQKENELATHALLAQMKDTGYDKLAEWKKMFDQARCN